MEKRKFHLDKTTEDAYGYTRGVKVGNTIYVSGVTGKGEMPDSIRSVYEKIGKVLEAYGAGFNHVVKENLFTTDLEAVKANKEVRLKFYDGDYPAATWVQIDRLFMPEYNLEVDVVAVIDI
jgi:2-iminobutanoate/2-iminopropanoate deaminase